MATVNKSVYSIAEDYLSFLNLIDPYDVNDIYGDRPESEVVSEIMTSITDYPEDIIEYIQEVIEACDDLEVIKAANLLLANILLILIEGGLR